MLLTVPTVDRAPAAAKSTTPIQALNLFNSTFAIEQAEAFASLLKEEAGGDVSRQVQQAYWLGLNRQPDSEELADAVSVVSEFGLSRFAEPCSTAMSFCLFHNFQHRSVLNLCGRSRSTRIIRNPQRQQGRWV
ncbi:MAG: DUF1553 domain-containing protein [Pirellulaceae bacterium]